MSSIMYTKYRVPSTKWTAQQSQPKQTVKWEQAFLIFLSSHTGFSRFYLILKNECQYIFINTTVVLILGNLGPGRHFLEWSSQMFLSFCIEHHPSWPLRHVDHSWRSKIQVPNGHPVESEPTLNWSNSYYCALFVSLSQFKKESEDLLNTI